MLASWTPVKWPRGERRLLNDSPTAFAPFPIAMEDLKAKQRAMMLVVIHQTASTIGQPRDIEQRVRQRIQLTVAQFSGFTLPA